MVLRAVVLPVALTYRVAKLAARAGFTAGRLSVETTYTVGRRVGPARLAAFAAGVGVGLLVAPTTGREARDRLRDRLGGLTSRGGPEGDDTVAERVRYELSHSPRTWHLPQPSVEVVGGTAILTGGAPHEGGKADIERAAASVPGVEQVDSRLVVGASGDGDTKP